VAHEQEDQFEDGVWLVELAGISNPALVAQQAATAIGMQLSSDRDAAEVLAGQIAERRLLLVVDNCEHLILACARLLERLLRSCPHLRVLATSREPLRVSGEVLWRVPSLSLPPAEGPMDLERLANTEAVRLFVERSAESSPGFRLDQENAASIAEICRRLDGMPLALELAAARSAALLPAQMAARLRDSLAILGGGNRGGLSRQQTLVGTIDWSHDLLDEVERALFRRLSIFAGAFSLEAAEWVCAGASLVQAEIPDVLGRLVEKSLIVTEGDTGERYYRLLETVRTYGIERLDIAGERELLERRHLDWYLALAQANDPEVGQVPGFADRLEREHDNLRAGLASALEHDTSCALLLATHLFAFWMASGYFAEGTRWMDEALARAPARTATRARALLYGCALAVRRGKPELWALLGAESVDIFREGTDRRALADALQHVGTLEWVRSDFDNAERLLEESWQIAAELQNCASLGAVRHSQALIAYCRSDYARSSAFLREAVEFFERAGDASDPIFPAATIGLVVVEDETDRPRCYFEETLMLFRRVSARAAVGWALCNLSNAFRSAGDFDGAGPPLDRALALFRELDDPVGGSMALSALGNLARSRGEFELGRGYLQQAMALRRKHRDVRGVGVVLGNLALLEARSGRSDRARVLLNGVLEKFTRTEDNPGLAVTQMNLGIVELAAGAWEPARRALEIGSSMMAAQLILRGALWALTTLAEGALDYGDLTRAQQYVASALQFLKPVRDTRAAARLGQLSSRLESAASADKRALIGG
jgi:predicted ATPase